jgi:hypothetical protein
MVKRKYVKMAMLARLSDDGISWCCLLVFFYRYVVYNLYGKKAANVYG